MFPYPCPSCDQRLLAPVERGGLRTICPKCLRPLTIPRPESASEEDPNSMVDPSEIPLTVMADTNTPYPGTIPVPLFASVEVSAATAVEVELRRAYAPKDLTFDLPEVPLQDRSGVNDSGSLRPSDAETPPPHTARLPIHTRRAANSDTRGMVVMNPTGLFSVDMTAELTAAISMRMNPPPEQAIDRRIIVGAWAFGTLSALSLWLGSLFYNPECLHFVAIVGGAMVAFGVLWRAYLISQDESVLKGVISLLPPFNIVRLFQKSGENGHRPLRFSASGAVALALFSTGAAARSYVESKPASGPVATSATETADKLRSVAEQPERLQIALREIGTARAAAASGADDKQATVAELQKLLKHASAAVRGAALEALREWSAADARQWVSAALAGTDSGACQMALKSAHQFAEPGIVAAVAKLLQSREHRIEAQRVSVAYGRAAEEPILELLSSANEATALSAMDVLVEIGGTKSLVALRRMADTAKSETLKSESASAADQLAAKLSK